MLQTSTALAISSITFTINILGWRCPCAVHVGLRLLTMAVLGEQGCPHGGQEASPSPSLPGCCWHMEAAGDAPWCEEGEVVCVAMLLVVLEKPAVTAPAWAGSAPRPLQYSCQWCRGNPSCGAHPAWCVPIASFWLLLLVPGSDQD